MDATQPARLIPQRMAYSVAEAEVLTSLSRATISRAIAAGELGSVKLGRRRIVPDADLRAFIERKRIAGSPTSPIHAGDDCAAPPS